MNLESSFISEIEYIKDTDNNIISGVYPMNAHLMSENNKVMNLGGSLEIMGTRFDEMGIPVGLYLEKHVYKESMNKQKNCLVIDDLLFDKLLGNVSSVKPYSGTKKYYSSTQNKKTKKMKI